MKASIIVAITLAAEFYFMPWALAGECSQQEGFIAEAVVDHLNS